MAKNEPNFSERIETARKAKQAQILRAREKDPANSPGFAERQAKRLEQAKARETRQAERASKKVADAERKAAEHAAKEIAKKERIVEEKEALEAEAIAKAEAEVQLKAKQKAARDAKYAARKARKR